ncbi:MAG: hypothetical protein OHK0048_02400 [Rhodoferax sp.]
MALLTRCPSCATLFRVVTDQLRVSQGWVKCGQCAEVFDASQHLLDVTLQGEIQATDSAPEHGLWPSPKAPSVSPPPSDAGSEAPKTVEPEPSAVLPSQPLAPQSPDPLAEFAGQSSPPSGVGESQREAAGQEKPDAAQQQGDPPEDAVALGPTDLQPEVRLEDSLPPQTGLPEQTPAWATRQAQVKPPRSGVWTIAVASGLVVALLQAVFWQRNTLAAWQPEFARVWNQACPMQACRVEALRRLDAIEVTQAALTQQAPNVLRLQTVVTNASGLSLAMPALELTLKDSQDAPVLRRVLRPQELKAPSVLAAGQRWVLDTALVLDPTLGQDRVSGYEVLAFYP